MSGDVNGDILIELNKGDLRQMLLVLKEHVPSNIRAYNYIASYLMHFDFINGNRANIESGRWNLRFYGPRSRELRNCTFVAITDRKDYFVSAFTLESDASELRNALANTGLIQWNSKTIEFFTETHIFELVKDIVVPKRTNNGWGPLEKEYVMYMPKTAVNNLPPRNIPRDLKVIALRTDHAETINDNWQYKRPNSYFLIRDTIALNGGLGLLRKSDDSLVAWIATNDFLALGFLYTIAAERRKGLGTFIFEEEMKRVCDKYDVDILTNVVCKNQTSFEMHRKMGFQAVNTIVFLGNE